MRGRILPCCDSSFRPPLMVRRAGIPALADYVTWLRNQADAYGRQVARDARRRLHDLAGQALSTDAAPMA